MKTAKDVAVDMVMEIGGNGFSRELFLLMIKDDSEAGRNLAKMIAVIEKHVERDRKAHASLRAPS